MKNISVSNKLSKVIIAKDLTIQQRDQNKKKRELKNKNNKQSLQKTKASEMKTIQGENFNIGFLYFYKCTYFFY
jgi:hypothetical protein